MCYMKFNLKKKLLSIPTKFYKVMKGINYIYVRCKNILNNVKSIDERNKLYIYLRYKNILNNVRSIEKNHA